MRRKREDNTVTEIENKEAEEEIGDRLRVETGVTEDEAVENLDMALGM